MTSVSVIIPTYNERRNISGIVAHSLDALSEYDAEVIIVDDDSQDLTWQVAREQFGDDDRVKVIRRTDESGLATAVTRGFNEATKEYCAVIDSDFQHPPEKLPELVDALNDGADLAIGSRYTDGGEIENWPWKRRLISKGSIALAKLSLSSARGIGDPVSGFFAVRRDLVDGIHLDPRGYKILLEVLVRCQPETVVEVPYTFTDRDRGESNLSLSQYQAYVEHLIALAVLTYGVSRFIGPSRAIRAVEFGFIGFLGTGVNMAVFGALNEWLGFHYAIAGISAFIVAVSWNFVGNWGLTFDRPKTGLIQKWVSFHVVSISGLVVYMLTLALMIQYVSIPPLVANLLAIVAGAAFNFFGTDEFVFDPEDEVQPTK